LRRRSGEDQAGPAGCDDRRRVSTRRRRGAACAPRHHQTLPRLPRQRPYRPHGHARRASCAARRERRRQEHPGQDHLWRRPRRRGRGVLGGPARRHPPSGRGAPPRHRHGVPALHPFRDAHGRREHRARHGHGRGGEAARGADRGDGRALRLGPRSAPLCARPLGRRAPARRSRALPDAGPSPVDHGRAHLGLDPSGGRAAVRDLAAARRGGLQHPLYQPQARRDHDALRARHGPPQRPGHRGVRPAPRDLELARPDDGGQRAGRLRPSGQASRRPRSAQGRGALAPRGRSVRNRARRHPFRGQARRDCRHRRGGREWPERAAPRAGRRAVGADPRGHPRRRRAGRPSGPGGASRPRHRLRPRGAPRARRGSGAHHDRERALDRLPARARRPRPRPLRGHRGAGTAHFPRFQGRRRRHPRGGAQPVGRQSPEVHHRPRGPAAAEAPDRRPPDLGCGRGRGARHPPGAHCAPRRGCGRAGGIGRPG